MAESDLFYATPGGAEDALVGVSIYADRPHIRALMQDDADALGFRVEQVGTLASLNDGGPQTPLRPIVLVDLPAHDPAHLARLAELDMTVARRRGQMIVSTSVGALDAVFGCLDQSGAQILVDPSPAERSLALGRIMLRNPELRVRELAEENRLMLLRLSEQVGEMAARLDKLLPPTTGDRDPGSAFRLESPRPAFAAQSAPDIGGGLHRTSRAPAPDPRLVRQILRHRQMRGKFFDPELFGDPAWDMLLDLTAARAEHLRVSVTSLCIASGVPPTTALRWIGVLTEGGQVQRVEDESDRRRAFIALTDKAADDMARYFAEIGSSAARLV